MTHLREIMKKLAAEHPDRVSEGVVPSSSSPEDLRGFIQESYRNKLTTCTPGMLQYELAWLCDRIEALELCVCQPEMFGEIGGLARAERMLADSRVEMSVLEEHLRERNIDALSHRHEVHPGEHAWEVTCHTLREKWGMD